MSVLYSKAASVSKEAKNRKMNDNESLADNGAVVGKDTATVNVIYGLNYLINKSNEMGICGVARRLQSAKEDIVYWAVQMNYHETTEEKFINTHLCDSKKNSVELQEYMQASPEMA